MMAGNSGVGQLVSHSRNVLFVLEGLAITYDLGKMKKKSVKNHDQTIHTNLS